MKLPEYRKTKIQGLLNGLKDIAGAVSYLELQQFVAQLEPDSREYQKYIYLAGELRKMKARFDAHLEKPKALALGTVESVDAPASVPENGKERK